MRRTMRRQSSAAMAIGATAALCLACCVPSKPAGLPLKLAETATFGELATALQEVIDQWQPQREHLVVNLAVAWDPIKTAAGNTPLDDPQARPIFQLINRASCLGAIVIAPAGNLTGSEGPLFPAGYEVRGVPTNEQCVQMGWPRKDPINQEQA